MGEEQQQMGSSCQGTRGEEPTIQPFASHRWEGKHALRSEHRLEAETFLPSFVFGTNLKGKDWVAACLCGWGCVRGRIVGFLFSSHSFIPLLLLMG